jgi:hypothetical protein
MEQAQDRHEWKKTVEKAKTPHELKRLLRRKKKNLQIRPAEGGN